MGTNPTMCSVLYNSMLWISCYTIRPEIEAQGIHVDPLLIHVTMVLSWPSAMMAFLVREQCRP